VGPEFEIFDTSTDIARINFVNTLVYGSVSGTTTVDLSGYVRFWLTEGPRTKGNLRVQVDIDPMSFY